MNLFTNITRLPLDFNVIHMRIIRAGLSRLYSKNYILLYKHNSAYTENKAKDIIYIYFVLAVVSVILSVRNLLAS